MTDSEERIMESFPLAVKELNFMLKCFLIWNAIITAALREKVGE